jgi:NADPH2:quinone reductase
MRAAWYEKQGLAREVLVVSEMPDPNPGAGEVRIRIAASGINPGDIKKRQDAFGYGMPYPRVIPHSDGAGQVDQVGEGVSSEWVGRAVWCYGAQSYRPFGTAAEFIVVPSIMSLFCLTMCRRHKALASGSLAPRLTAPSTSGAA